MRLLFVSQLPRLLLFLQLSTSLMDVISASPPIVSATLSSLFCWKLSSVFAIRLALISQLPRLLLASQIPTSWIDFVSATARIISNIFSFPCSSAISSHENPSSEGI